MTTSISVDASDTHKAATIEALSLALVSVIQAGGDREVTIEALRSLRTLGGNMTNISDCTFTNNEE